MSHNIEPVPPPWKFNGLTGCVHAANKRKVADVCARVDCNPDSDLSGQDLLRVGKLIALAPMMLEKCITAKMALRSYQYGNASPDLAEEIADALDAVIEAAKGGAA